MAKRALLRELRKLPKTLDGIKVSIGRSLSHDGRKLAPGDDVPKELLASPNLRALVRNGYIVPETPVDHRFLGATPKPKPKPAAPKPPSAAEAAEDVGPSSTKSEIRAELEKLGVEVPSGATKAELVDLLSNAKA